MADGDYEASAAATTTPSEGYRRADSVDSQMAAMSSADAESPVELNADRDIEENEAESGGAAALTDHEEHEELLMKPLRKQHQAMAAGTAHYHQHHHHHHRHQLHNSHRSLYDGQSFAGSAGKQPTGRAVRQKKFAQRSILKNSQDNSHAAAAAAAAAAAEDQELLEAKKQIILRRRRLFSHYRQYEQWRRRQFSYDPCYYRAIPTAAPICGSDFSSLHHSVNPTAFRRRRQYRRQFSCAERSREESHDSRGSSNQLAKSYSMMAASDTIRTDSTQLMNTNPPTMTSERHSVS